MKNEGRDLKRTLSLSKGFTHSSVKTPNLKHNFRSYDFLAFPNKKGKWTNEEPKSLIMMKRKYAKMTEAYT